MATDQLINKSQGDAIISGLTAIKNAINDQPVPTQVEDVVADAFDVGVSYVPGDYCIYENKLYVCDVAHHGAWDGNDFTLTTVGAVLESLNNDLSKHSLGSGVALTSNVTYTCPSDGYFCVRTTNASNQYGYGYIDNVLLLNVSTPTSTTLYTDNSDTVFVRKGTQIKWKGTASGTFYPIT